MTTWNEMKIETLMDSLKNCRKAISQTVPFSQQSDTLVDIETAILADLRKLQLADLDEKKTS